MFICLCTYFYLVVWQYVKECFAFLAMEERKNVHHLVHEILLFTEIRVDPELTLCAIVMTPTMTIRLLNGKHGRLITFQWIGSGTPAFLPINQFLFRKRAHSTLPGDFGLLCTYVYTLFRCGIADWPV